MLEHGGYTGNVADIKRDRPEQVETASQDDKDIRETRI